MPPLTDRARGLNPPHDQTTTRSTVPSLSTRRPTNRRPNGSFACRSAPLPCLANATATPGVSTVAQADKGQSLDAQQCVIRGHATMPGRAVQQVFIERGVLGSNPLATAPQGRRVDGHPEARRRSDGETRQPALVRRPGTESVPRFDHCRPVSPSANLNGTLPLPCPTACLRLPSWCAADQRAAVINVAAWPGYGIA